MWNVTDRFRVRVLPEPEIVVPAPLMVHWLFCVTALEP